MTKTPVLLMLFNRAETTEKVFQSLRESKPAKLFIAANGPRPDVPEDVAKCQAVKDIFKRIDWECEVRTYYQKTNIGMQPQWYTALDWFFEHVESGVILEDDCVPNASFFSFCETLLEKYRTEEKVMHINGSNFQFGRKRGDASYYFSEYPHVWGWATWRRAWSKYDRKLSSFPKFKESGAMDRIANSAAEKNYWMKFFESIYSGRRDGSDVKWLYSIWANGGICITPNINMISNIGFGADAEHTVIKDRIMDQDKIELNKVVHPKSAAFAPDRDADIYTFSSCFSKTFFQKAYYVVVSRASKLFR